MDGRTDVYVDHACVAMTYYLDYYTEEKTVEDFVRELVSVRHAILYFFSVSKALMRPLLRVYCLCV